MEKATSRKRPAKSRKNASSRGKISPIVLVGGGVVAILVVGIIAILFWPRTSSNVPVAHSIAWQSFQHRAGGFSVEVPNALHKIPTREAGDDFSAIQISGEHPYAVHVNCMILPKEATAGTSVQRVLTKAANVIADRRKIEQQSNVWHNKYQGLEFLIVGPKGNRRSRLFLHHDVVIELAVTWDNVEPITERDRFWNSIQFTR